jgi:hypothetical protein
MLNREGSSRANWKIPPAPLSAGRRTPAGNKGGNIGIWWVIGIILLMALLYLPSLEWPLERETLEDYVFPLATHRIADVPAWILVKSLQRLTFIRPLFTLSMYLDFQVWGLNAWGYRLSNLGFQIVVLLGVYALGRMLFRHTGWALLATALFAFHPNAFDSVTLTYGRSDLTLMMFVLWGLWFWGKYLLSPPYQGGQGGLISQGRLWFTLALILFTLGLFSKENALMFPFIALLLHFILNMQGRMQKSAGLRPWHGYAAMAVIIAGYWFIRLQILGGVGGHLGAKHLLPPLTLILRNVLHILDGGFLVERGYGSVAAEGKLFWICGTAIAAVVAIIALRPRRRGDGGWASAFGFGLMALGSMPLLTFTWLGWWYIYTAMVGATLGVAGVFKELADRGGMFKKAALMGAVIIPILLLGISRQQMQVNDRIQNDWKAVYTYAERHCQPDVPGKLYFWSAMHVGMVLLRFDYTVEDKSDFKRLIFMKQMADEKWLFGHFIFYPESVVFQSEDRIMRAAGSGPEQRITPMDEPTFRAETTGRRRH